MLDLGAENADAIHKMCSAGLHEADLLASLEDPVDDAHQNNDAEIGIVPTVNEHGFQGSRCIAPGWRDLVDNRLEHFLDSNAGFRGGENGVRCVKADDLFNFLPH